MTFPDIDALTKVLPVEALVTIFCAATFATAVAEILRISSGLRAGMRRLLIFFAPLIAFGKFITR